MSSTMSGGHSEKISLGKIVFKDLCETIAFARAKRKEYFSKLFSSRHQTDRSEQGKTGHVK